MKEYRKGEPLLLLEKITKYLTMLNRQPYYDNAEKIIEYYKINPAKATFAHSFGGIILFLRDFFQPYLKIYLTFYRKYAIIYKKGVLNMDKVEQIIKEIDGSMRIEGMALTENDKDNIRMCIASPEKTEMIISSIVKHYTQMYKNK